MDLIKNYFRQIKRARSNDKLPLNYFYLLKIFFVWKKFLDSKHNPLVDEQPWINFKALDKIKSLIKANMSGFEFGCGGSTLFFLRKVKSLVSVEHDKEWFEKTKSKISGDIINKWNGQLLPPVQTDMYDVKKLMDPEFYFSTGENFHGYDFMNYSKFIDTYPDNYFDFVVVDGRARPSCIKHSLNKVRIHGYLILDNSDREYYLGELDQNSLDGTYSRIFHHFGPGPYCVDFWATTIWQKMSI